MTTDLRPYPKYRDSKLTWLDGIPEHWEERRAKYYFREVDERSATGAEQLMSVSHLTGVTPRKSSVTMFMAESSVGYKICRPGDLVINTMWAWMAAMGIARQIGLVSPAYGVYRPLDAMKHRSNYIDYLLRTQPYISEYICRSTGIRPSRLRLYPDEFLDIPIVCPTPTEQDKIVQFIGHHNRNVGRFIRNRRRLIEVLNEQKQAIINRAVTRGLDPSVSLKQSGIDWLGDVPVHWEVKRLRRLAGVRLSNVDKVVDKGETPVNLCNYVDVYHNEFITENIDFMQGNATDVEIEAFQLHSDDVLITKDSESWEDIAVPAFVPRTLEGVVCGYHLAVVRPWQQVIDGEYLARAFTAEPVTIQFRVAANGVTRYGLSLEAIKSAFFPLPPLNEQRAIAASIAQQFEQIALAITQAECEIDLIREYRTRLIADVVTGKVDVRGLAPTSGEETTECEHEELAEGNDADVIQENDQLERIEGAADAGD